MLTLALLSATDDSGDALFDAARRESSAERQVELLQRAALTGHAASAKMLGLAYAQGHGGLEPDTAPGDALVPRGGDRRRPRSGVQPCRALRGAPAVRPGRRAGAGRAELAARGGRAGHGGGARDADAGRGRGGRLPDGSTRARSRRLYGARALSRRGGARPRGRVVQRGSLVRWRRRGRVALLLWPRARAVARATAAAERGGGRDARAGSLSKSPTSIA